MYLKGLSQSQSYHLKRKGFEWWCLVHPLMTPEPLEQDNWPPVDHASHKSWVRGLGAGMELPGPNM